VIRADRPVADHVGVEIAFGVRRLRSATDGKSPSVDATVRRHRTSDIERAEGS
jgi:hypothetical protein